MSLGSQGIFAACSATAVYLRVVGPGVSRNSKFLQEYGLKKVQEGYRKFYIDLARCENLDSTFLGVFAGLALALNRSGTLSLIDLGGESRRAFTDLGLDQMPALETVPNQAVQAVPEIEFQLLPGSDLSTMPRAGDPLDRAVLMLECHEYLCRIDRRNEEKFRDVKQFLREDIARHQSDQPSDDDARHG